MESSFLPRAKPRSQLLDMQRLSGEQFLKAHTDVVKAVEQALQPFHFSASPVAEGIRIEGDEVAVMIASRIFQQVRDGAGAGNVDLPSLAATISGALAHALRHDLGLFLKGLSRVLAPKSLSQSAFLQTLLASEGQLVIGLGPTGTGKTYLAVAAALNQLAEERVKHVVITRPHVVLEGEIVSAATRWELEADSQLDYFDDILHDLIGHDRVCALKKEQVLEVIPLGRMRGRTFKNAFIILDEAQNTTVAKMRMAVTRIGRGSRMVVTGDPTNVELLGDEQSGLIDLLNLLEGTDFAKIHRFDSSAIIRDSVAIRLEELYAARQNRGQNIAPVDAFGRRSGPIQRSEVSAARTG